MGSLRQQNDFYDWEHTYLTDTFRVPDSEIDVR
jgi:hypothetical protein